MDLAKFVETATPLRALGVIVSQNGAEIARYMWEEPCRRDVCSVSKSMTSAAVGIACREGLLSLDEKLVDAFREDLPDEVSENLAKATVRDLLTMCLGQGKEFMMGEDRPYHADRDWVKLSLRQPFVHEPGTQFLYNNVGPYLAGVLVQRRAGCNLAQYLNPRLFQPMGIQRPSWEIDPLDYTFGASGLFWTIDEMHQFGQLYLQNGCWEGKQLIPEEWVRASTSRQVDNGRDPYGYGYLFWRGEQNSYRMYGKYGQFSIVIPDKHAVVSTTAECRDANLLLAAVFSDIYPQL